MLWWFSRRAGDTRVVVLGLANSTAMIAGAGALLVLLGRRIRRAFPVGASLVRSLGCAAAAYGAARLIVELLPSGTRIDAALTVVVGTTLAAGVYAGLQWLARAPEFRGITSGGPAWAAPGRSTPGWRPGTRLWPSEPPLPPCSVW